MEALKGITEEVSEAILGHNLAENTKSLLFWHLQKHAISVCSIAWQWLVTLFLQWVTQAFEKLCTTHSKHNISWHIEHQMIFCLIVKFERGNPQTVKAIVTPIRTQMEVNRIQCNVKHKSHFLHEEDKQNIVDWCRRALNMCQHSKMRLASRCANYQAISQLPRMAVSVEFVVCMTQPWRVASCMHALQMQWEMARSRRHIWWRNVRVAGVCANINQKKSNRAVACRHEVEGSVKRTMKEIKVLLARCPNVSGMS